VALDDLVRLPEPTASVSPGAVETVVTYVDSFGNLRLAGGRHDLEAAFGGVEDGQPLIVEFGATTDHRPVREATRYGTTFGTVPPGGSLVYVDSLGNLAMADNQGNLAGRLGIGHDRPLRISRG
jgi:S-adenosyl-L-methionine hydrolase (adenosine-forming)